MTKSKISLAVIFLLTVFVLIYVGKVWISKSTYFGGSLEAPKTLYYKTSHLYETRHNEYKRTLTITNGLPEDAYNISISITSSTDITGHSHPGMKHDGTDRVVSETLIGNTFSTLIDEIPTQESIQIIIYGQNPFDIEHVDLGMAQEDLI